MTQHQVVSTIPVHISNVRAGQDMTVRRVLVVVVVVMGTHFWRLVTHLRRRRVVYRIDVTMWLTRHGKRPGATARLLERDSKVSGRHQSDGDSLKRVYKNEISSLVCVDVSGPNGPHATSPGRQGQTRIDWARGRIKRNQNACRRIAQTSSIGRTRRTDSGRTPAPVRHANLQRGASTVVGSVVSPDLIYNEVLNPISVDVRQ